LSPSQAHGFATTVGKAAAVAKVPEVAQALDGARTRSYVPDTGDKGTALVMSDRQPPEYGSEESVGDRTSE
jgi:hypothetical protein